MIIKHIVEGDKMSYNSRIELYQESGNRDPKKVGVPYFMLDRFDAIPGRPAETVEARALFLDDHYVLMEHYHSRPPGARTTDVLGVSHDIGDVSKRLHAHLKERAERMANIHNITNLIDTTEHAPEKLPRGGK